jgi:TPR repeat protein
MAQAGNPPPVLSQDPQKPEKPESDKSAAAAHGDSDAPADAESAARGKQDSSSDSAGNSAGDSDTEAGSSVKQQESVHTNAAADAQVAIAQRFLRGQGTPQDCNRGVQILRNAAGQGSARANVQLGALYSIGQCVSQDRVQAYSWFAKAAQLEPRNNRLATLMNSLWSQMSSDERSRVTQ